MVVFVQLEVLYRRRHENIVDILGLCNNAPDGRYGCALDSTHIDTRKQKRVLTPLSNSKFSPLQVFLTVITRGECVSPPSDVFAALAPRLSGCVSSWRTTAVVAWRSSYTDVATV